MCGRFTQKLSSPELARIFDAEDQASLPGERYNVAPTDPVAAVLLRDGRRVLAPFRWGLVPHWAADSRGGSRMINARAETIERSPAFRDAFERKRCLIPADGFYEWRRTPDGRRLPSYVTSTDGRPLAFAGLRSTWRGGRGALGLAGDTGAGAGAGARAEPEPLRTCSIVTTRANDLVSRLHDRMPVILGPEAWPLWLDPATPAGELRALLEPAPADGLRLYPVSTLVNDVRKNGPQLIEPAGEPSWEPLLR